jgi:hypothetical protein
MSTTTAGSDDPFQRFAAQAMEYSIPRTRRLLPLLHAGSKSVHIDWRLHGDELELLVNGSPRVHARFQWVGHLYHQTMTWKWAWAETANDPKLTSDSLLARDHGAKHGLHPLTTAEFPIEQPMPTQLSAITAMLSGADATWLLALRAGVIDHVVLHSMAEVRPSS